MGRKKSRKSRTSKKSMNSISKNIKKMMRAEKKADIAQKMLNKLDAWKKGKNVIVHEEGKTTRESIIRKDARDVWGDPNRKFSIGRK
jgi:ADP-ribosylglycohydrolase